MIVSQFSSIGKREYQQDAGIVRLIDKATAIVLCDGMGGHSHGADASEVATAATFRTLEKSSDEPSRRLLRAVESADMSIRDLRKNSASGELSGTTIIAALVIGSTLHWVSIGDSILLRIRGRNITRLNADHSMAPLLDAMASNGEISRDDAENHPDRNALLSALTGSGIKKIDQSKASLLPGDIIISASDGLLTLTESEILTTICDAQPPNIAEDLVCSVLDKNLPDQDNVFVISGVFIQRSKAIVPMVLDTPFTQRDL